MRLCSCEHSSVGPLRSCVAEFDTEERALADCARRQADYELDPVARLTRWEARRAGPESGERASDARDWAIFRSISEDDVPY